MAKVKVHGSGGYITADLTDEQAKKADLGVGRLFLAPIGKLESNIMYDYFCKMCKKEFSNPPTTQIEEKPNEKVSEDLILVERGQYKCQSCDGIIGEYRVFKKLE